MQFIQAVKPCMTTVLKRTVTVFGNSRSSLKVGTNRDACTLSATTNMMTSVAIKISTIIIKCQSFEYFISCKEERSHYEESSYKLVQKEWYGICSSPSQLKNISAVVM